MKKNKSRVIFLMIVIFTMLLSLSTVVNAAEPILGKGTEKSPYIINMDNVEPNQAGQKYIEIQYEDLANFYFKIDGDKSSGTYCVEYDKENKTVGFTYYNSDNKVLYTRTRQNSEYYMQAGTSPSTTSDALDTSKVPFKIETTEKCDGTIFYLNATNKSEDKRTYVLKNAPLNENPDVPHPSYFVFTKSGTAEELFESVSEANCAGTDFKSKSVRYAKVTGLFTTRNVAELIIDPKPISSNLSPAIVIRYADWEEDQSGNKIVKNQDKYKVDVVYHFIGQDTDEEDKAGDIQTAITSLFLGIGEVFMFAIRLFLGSSVTMDSIIFNRYNETIIDLRGRAGIFANDTVRNIINTMYSGFEWLAIIAFIVILLYLGINIILSVGTDKQSKYFKNLENWVIGVAILFIFPRFFPYITDISNGIVSYLGKGATPMYTQYNIIAILNDEAIIGENAQTVEIDELISDATKEKEARIATLQKEIEKSKSANRGLLNKLRDFAKNWHYKYNSERRKNYI